jgi:hypothetical protein
VSEYQYYEFVAVDRPLTPEHQGELRALSTRARITSSSFVNDYQWGDLKGDPSRWMERYFDAHLYLANWGTHRIALRLPRAVLTPEAAGRYCVGDSARSWATGTHVIVDLRSEDEDGDEEWCDPEGQLSAVVPARSELAAGDLRLLYLAWLLCVQNEEVDDDEPEPPVPAGLAELSGPLQALADFLRVDPDLLTAAAEASRPPQAKAPSAAVLGRWVRALPEADKDELLLRVLRGDGALLRPELLRRFHGKAGEPVAGAGRTAGQLLTAAEKHRTRRQQRIREHDAAERQRREQEAAAAREQRLDALARNPKRAWQQIDALIEARKAKEYDVAVALLADLHGLAVRDKDTAAFAQRMRRLRDQHGRKPSLLDRFDRARLG